MSTHDHQPKVTQEIASSLGLLPEEYQKIQEILEVFQISLN